MGGEGRGWGGVNFGQIERDNVNGRERRTGSEGRGKGRDGGKME